MTMCWDIPGSMQAPFEPLYGSIAVTDRGIAVADDSGRVRVIDVRTRRTKWTTTMPNSPVSLVWNSRSRRIVAACPSQIMVLLPETGKSIASLSLPARLSLTSVALSPDGQKIAASFGTHTTWTWRWQTSKTQTVHHFTDAIYSVAFLPDSKRVACAGYNRLHMLDLSSGRDSRSKYGDVSYAPDAKGVLSLVAVDLNHQAPQAARLIAGEAKHRGTQIGLALLSRGQILASLWVSGPTNRDAKVKRLRFDPAQGKGKPREISLYSSTDWPVGMSPAIDGKSVFVLFASGEIQNHAVK